MTTFGMASSRATAAAKRSCPARREQSEIARVVPFCNGHFANSKRHLSVGDAYNTERRLFNCHSKRFGDLLAHHSASSFQIKPHFAAEKVGQVEPAENQVCICNGRVVATTAVAGWTRRRARTQWTNFERTCSIEPGDASAAGTHFHDRSLAASWGSRIVSTNVISRHDFRLPADDEAGLGGGSAHIE